MWSKSINGSSFFPLFPLWIVEVSFVVVIFLLVTVPRCHKSNSGKRTCDKKHICLFCAVNAASIAKHLQRHHKNEEEVKSLLKLNKNNKGGEAKPKTICAIFRPVVTFFHNMKACVRAIFLSNFYFPQNDSPSKTMKNIFYFI